MNTNEIPTNSGRLIVFGDIHGHADRLRKMLEEIDVQPDDIVVFLGDFVDRGPDSKGVIDEVINLADKCKVYCICGNHEEMILMCVVGGKDDSNYWKKFGGKEALASYGVDNAKEIPGQHLRFIADCKDYCESEDFIFVHAWCDPDKPLSESKPETLRWVKLPDSPAPHFSGKTVICGHTAQKTVLNLGHTICIDTGCGIWPGGRLTALDVKSGKIWQFGGNAKKVTVKQLSEYKNET